MGAYHAAAELGLRIPEDLSIVGFDNQELIAEGLRPDTHHGRPAPLRDGRVGRGDLDRHASRSRRTRRTRSRWNCPARWFRFRRSARLTGPRRHRTDIPLQSTHVHGQPGIPCMPQRRERPMPTHTKLVALLGAPRPRWRTLGPAARRDPPAAAPVTRGGVTTLELWTHNGGNPAELAANKKVVDDFNASQRSTRSSSSRSRRRPTTTRSPPRPRPRSCPACGHRRPERARTGPGPATSSRSTCRRTFDKQLPSTLGTVDGKSTRSATTTSR